MTFIVQHHSTSGKNRIIYNPCLHSSMKFNFPLKIYKLAATSALGYECVFPIGSDWSKIILKFLNTIEAAISLQVYNLTLSTTTNTEQ